jgi:hypothetical protein
MLIQCAIGLAYMAAATIAAETNFQTCYVAAVALASTLSIAVSSSSTLSLSSGSWFSSDASLHQKTAAAAAAAIANGTSFDAAGAAIVAASTAAIAAAYQDPTYMPIYGPLRTALYAPQIQLILNDIAAKKAALPA